ncbi:hypothetical protein THL1_1219 [Pseudomonas sp. TCU-HL1]|nr:hypothetical protein THL1_1219 [Pseudomonas sp. TCU-HL1]
MTSLLPSASGSRATSLAGVVRQPLLRPCICRRGDRSGAALVAGVVSMSWPFHCRSACRLHARDVRSGGPPGCGYFCPRLPTKGCGNRRPASPDYPTQQRKGTEKAEGKIKGGGTSLARKAVCTGVGDGTQCMHRRALHSANARHFWLWRVPNTPHCDQFGTDITPASPALELDRGPNNRLLDGGERSFEDGISAVQYQSVAKVSKATAPRHLLAQPSSSSAQERKWITARYLTLVVDLDTQAKALRASHPR